MGRIKGIQVTLESWMIVNGKIGEHFYSDKADKDLTSISAYYNRKIVTERLISVTTGKLNPEAKCITKITLL